MVKDECSEQKQKNETKKAKAPFFQYFHSIIVQKISPLSNLRLVLLQYIGYIFTRKKPTQWAGSICIVQLD